MGAEIGKRFGRLVVEAVEKRPNDHVKWVRCICDCGRMKSVRLSSIRSGFTQSCGCLNREKHTRHGYLAKNYPHRSTYHCW